MNTWNKWTCISSMVMDLSVSLLTPGEHFGMCDIKCGLREASRVCVFILFFQIKFQDFAQLDSALFNPAAFS